MLFFAYFSSYMSVCLPDCLGVFYLGNKIHVFHFSYLSTTVSDDDIPTENCICIMKFMIDHPNQSWDPTRASIAVIHDGAAFVRVALLAQNETSWYRIREMEAEGCPEILSAKKCNGDTAEEYLVLSIIINKYFIAVFQQLSDVYGSHEQITVLPLRFNIAECPINLSKHCDFTKFKQLSYNFN